MSRKELIQQVRPHVALYRDPSTGLAWVEDGTTGCGHSAHPNIHYSGSIRGMKERGFWSKNDRTVRSHGFIYNVSVCRVDDDLDRLARDHCRCGGFHGADAHVTGGGTIYLVHPVTQAAKDWIQEHVGLPGEETHYLGDALAVEHRYIRDLVDGMQADGLTVR